MRRYIYVAGVDHEFKGVDFRTLCQNRLKRTVLSNRTGEELHFTILDVKRGEITTTEVSYAGGKKAEKTAKTSPYRAITRADYDASSGADGSVSYSFKEDIRDVMSILDAYSALRKCGVDHPGTLDEFTIFSHGWMGGPILVNSYNDGLARFRLPWIGNLLPPVQYRLPSNVRDPDDKDGRSEDFGPPTLDAGAIQNIRAAFGPGGRAWLWGCAFPRRIHSVLTKMEKHRAYKTKGLDGETELTFTNMTADDVDVLELFLDPDLSFPNHRKVVIKFKHLMLFASRAVVSSYLHHFAVASGAGTYGALLGTYTEFDGGALGLVHVNRGFAGHFTFYQNYLGFVLDPEGRKYGKYVPGFTCPAFAP